MNASEREKFRKTSNKPRNVKYHNQKLILSMLRDNETLSVADISGTAKLSKTTINKVINAFEEKNLIVPVGKGASTGVGGKKPERFAFNATHSYIIALSVAQNKIYGALSDLKCNLLYQREVECGIQVGYQQAVRDMADMVTGLLDDSRIPPDRLCSIVIGSEGIIDAANNEIYYTMHHTWGRNLPIAADLARLLPFRITIHLDNNVRLAGFAHSFLNPDQYGTIVVISSARSAGGCIIEGQQLVRGEHGFVGELGHMIIEPFSDVRCTCGAYGCFGALISPDIVLGLAHREYMAFPRSELYGKSRDNALTIGDIFAAANAGDEFARLLLDRVIQYFSILIHNIVLMRDPVEIIIQGMYSSAGEYFLDTLRKKISALPFYKMEHSLAISYSPATAINTYLVGAVYYAVDKFLGANGLYD